MHARRAILPIAILAAYACVHGASRGGFELEDDHHAVAQVAVDEAPQALDELKRRIARIIERENIAGISIAVVGRDGPIWVGGLGVRDRETGAPADGTTAYRVGSLSKSIVALAVMRLVDQGKLDIDRPLRELLPGLIENPWEATAPVTIAQCLEHTAGLDDVRFNEIFTDDEQLSVRDTLALNPRSRIVRWQPGTRHSYSNVGYTLAARAIEVATGEPFDTYIRREILAPIGIVDADFHRTSTLTPRLAVGYDDGEPMAFHPFAHRPSGALLASASDLAKLVHFLVRRGDGYPPIVSRAGLARIERSGTLPYPPLVGDYGLANYGDTSTPVLSRGHDGGMPGFHSSFRYFPELGIGYAFLLNSGYTFRGYSEIRALLFAYLTQGRAFPPPPDPVAHDATPGADFYAFAAPRNELFAFIDRATMGWRVWRSGDHLIRMDQLNGEDSSFLVPTRDGGYRFVGEYGSSVRFLTRDDGTPIMVMGFTYGEAASGWVAELRYYLLGLVMVLFHIAPLWAAAVLAYGVLRRRRVAPASLVLWPAVAGLACSAVWPLMMLGFHQGVIGLVHPVTIAICGITILLAVASTATLVAAIRWSVRPDRPRLLVRLFPTACGVAFAGFTLWLAANGLIGLRTWAW